MNGRASIQTTCPHCGAQVASKSLGDLDALEFLNFSKTIPEGATHGPCPDCGAQGVVPYPFTRRNVPLPQTPALPGTTEFDRDVQSEDDLRQILKALEQPDSYEPPALRLGPPPVQYKGPVDVVAFRERFGGMGAVFERTYELPDEPNRIWALLPTIDAIDETLSHTSVVKRNSSFAPFDVMRRAWFDLLWKIDRGLGALVQLSSYARRVRAGKRIDLRELHFFRIINGLPHASRLSSAALRNLETLMQYATSTGDKRSIDVLFGVRFGVTLKENFRGSATMQDLRDLWSILEHNPDQIELVDSLSASFGALRRSIGIPD